MSSRWAIEPPPAPISISSRVEMRTGRPLPSTKRFSRAASKLYATVGLPSSTIESLAVDPVRLEARRKAARERGRPESAIRIAASLVDLLPRPVPMGGLR